MKKKKLHIANSKDRAHARTAKVMPLNCVTYLDLPPDRILEEAKGDLDGVVIIGYDKDGNEYFASSYADGGVVLWLLEKAKESLLHAKVETYPDCKPVA